MDYTVGIIGNGPSALALLFLLAGNRPYYDPSCYGPHPDKMLHELLLDYTFTSKTDGGRSLFDAVKDEQVMAYISTHYSSFYSASMLPFNLLIDTLVAANESDFAAAEFKQSRISWHKTSQGVSSIALGSGSSPGGQWSSHHTELDDPNQKTLSYSEMLSLPGYSFEQFYVDAYGGSPGEYYRPKRREVSEYYGAYAMNVGVSPRIKSAVTVTHVDRDTSDGAFTIRYDTELEQHHEINTKFVVIATGVHESPLIESKPLSYRQLTRLVTHGSRSSSHTIRPPLITPPCEDLCSHGPSSTMVIGSGVSAAEAIKKCLPGSSVVHIYKWDDVYNEANPLRRFPKELYPDYHSIYRLMKQRGKNTQDYYEGLPNARITEVCPDGMVEIQLESGQSVWRKVNEILVRTGRFSTLQYLSPKLQGDYNTARTTKSSIRKRLDAESPDLQLRDGLYAVGSLTGDTLVRFLIGGCVWVAGDILDKA